MRALPGNGEWWMDANEHMGNGKEEWTSRKSKREKTENRGGKANVASRTHVVCFFFFFKLNSEDVRVSSKVARSPPHRMVA